MIQSDYYIGQVIENALKRAQMLSFNKYGLSQADLMRMYDESMVEVAKIHFETDKEQYYDSRTAQATTNAKFASSGGTYDNVTGLLTITMTPVASLRDIGKVITFFDGSQPANMPRGFTGIIAGFIPNTTTQYQVTTFYPIPALLNVTNITVIDYLMGGDSIRFLQNNEIFSPENMEIYDISNNEVIDLVSYTEFSRRLSISKYSSGSSRWARFKQSSVDFWAGSNAPPMGTLSISAYWIPPKAVALNSYCHISNKRIGEVEERLLYKINSIKTGVVIQEPDVTRAELATENLKDSQTRKDLDKVT